MPTATIAPSTIPAAKTALISILAALHADEPDVEVTWGKPTGELAREWIMVGDASGTQQTAVFGSRHRDERYTITVVYSILEETGDSQTATLRAFELAALLEVDLRFNHTDLNGTVQWALVDGPIDLREFSRGVPTESQLTITITCRARI
jgi:hypothetical protein